MQSVANRQIGGVGISDNAFIDIVVEYNGYSCNRLIDTLKL